MRDARTPRYVNASFLVCELRHFNISLISHFPGLPRERGAGRAMGRRGQGQDGGHAGHYRRRRLQVSGECGIVICDSGRFRRPSSSRQQCPDSVLIALSCDLEWWGLCASYSSTNILIPGTGYLIIIVSGVLRLKQVFWFL